MTGRKKFFAASDGATALEFAFVAVALVLFVFGALEMGRMLWTQEVLQAAATETARCLAIGSASCPSAGTFAVNSAAQRGLAGVQSANVVVLASDSCGSATGTFTKVTITYVFSPVVPAVLPAPVGGLTASACFPH